MLPVSHFSLIIIKPPRVLDKKNKTFLNGVFPHSPEFEYMFPLLVVMCYLTHCLAKAYGYLSMVWNAIASALVIFVETKTSFP